MTGIYFVKTTNLIHDLEMRRDSFLRLQEEGKRGKAGFVTFEDIQNMEQVHKWTTSKVGLFKLIKYFHEYIIHGGAG